MHTSVREIFPAFSEQFEGKVPWMYLDIKGLVTTGIGNLIDPIEHALALPWRSRSSGNPAVPMEVAAEWHKIKAETSLARRGHKAAQRLCQLYLDDAAIAELVLGKLDDNERILTTRYFDCQGWPADAQLALHSMAWALGPHFSRGWPRFSNACRKGDFIKAAGECRIADADNPGVTPRNAANRRLLANAAACLADGGDPTVLRYRLGDA